MSHSIAIPLPHSNTRGEKLVATSKLQLDNKQSRVHVFLSRINPCCTDNDLRIWIKEAGLTFLEIERLEPKFSKQDYSSYHVTLDKGEHEYEYFLLPSIWPSGVFVKRWFLPKRKQLLNNEPSKSDELSTELTDLDKTVIENKSMNCSSSCDESNDDD